MSVWYVYHHSSRMPTEVTSKPIVLVILLEVIPVDMLVNSEVTEDLTESLVSDKTDKSTICSHAIPRLFILKSSCATCNYVLSYFTAWLHVAAPNINL